MELFVYAPDTGGIDMTYHREVNLAAVKSALAAGVAPTTVTLTNSVPEMDFTREFILVGCQERLTFPVIQLMKDLMSDSSSLCRRLGLSGSSIDEKGAAFMSIWEKCFAGVFSRTNSLRDVTYDVFYGDPLVDELAVMGGEAKGPHFSVYLPEDLVKKYYPHPVCCISGLKDRQQFFDLSKLSREEFVEYVVPKYYLDLSELFRYEIRRDPIKMSELSRGWVDTLFAALG